MRYEQAILQAIEETQKSIPTSAPILLQILLRAGELTTDTSKCEKCGSGG